MGNLPRVRKDIQKLTPQERDTLIRAFQHIVSLDPDHENSYFTIAGYHGLPGFYCYHETILFPTWHRAFLLRLENALRSAPGCGDLALPYWNEISQDTIEHGIPTIFTDKNYRFVDGSSIPNPLFSYKMQQTIEDGGDNTNTKPEGYQTVRYPYSGLVSGKWTQKTAFHNAAVDQNPPEKVLGILNDNIKMWLTAETFENHEGKTITAGEAAKFKKCLDAPNYTVFSNVRSAANWNKDRLDVSINPIVVPLETPHNAIHLAVGGFDVPGPRNHNSNVYPFANGDMGANETAAFDPVFFFHHCFIDYTFWRWQDRHNKTTELDILPDYPGATPLTLDSPLRPFKAVDPSTGAQRDMTSRDVINPTALGYTYPAPLHAIVPAPKFVDAPKLFVGGINRRNIHGSFIITTWEKGADSRTPDRLLHVDPRLSRWDVAQCENCLQNLDVESYVHLTDFSAEDAVASKFFAKLHTKDNLEGDDWFEGDQIKVELKAVPDAERAGA